jgi:hypothetical protein
MLPAHPPLDLSSGLFPPESAMQFSSSLCIPHCIFHEFYLILRATVLWDVIKHLRRPVALSFFYGLWWLRSADMTAMLVLEQRKNVATWLTSARAATIRPCSESAWMPCQRILVNKTWRRDF